MAIQKMQVRSPSTFHLTPVSMTINKKTNYNKSDKDVGKEEPLLTDTVK